VTRGSLAWVRRLSFAAVLIVAAVAPGPAAGSPSHVCAGVGGPGTQDGPGCGRAGAVRWARPLPGAWIARAGLLGTTPAHGQAYAALGGQVAALGSGLTVSAYRARNGQPLWTAALTGFPAGSAIVSVRVWPGVVTAGVGLPAAGGAAAQEEVVLAAATGRRIRTYPSAPFGGAVMADADATVIVGAHAVTSYANRTGAVLWSRPTSRAAQAWQEDGGALYVTVSAGGYLGTAPVTALRQINLRTGAERLVRPRGHAFAGPLSLAFDGVVLFAGASGVTAYSGGTGARLWHRRAGLPEGVDVVGRRLYLLVGSALVGSTRRPGTGWPGSPAPPPPNPAGCTGCGRARCSDSITARSARRGATTSPPSGCCGLPPRCRGRTISSTCPGSAGAPHHGGTGCCWPCAPNSASRRRLARRGRACGPN
jgi:putative pyrroloquinoline-quinone binding quinoprotein